MHRAGDCAYRRWHCGKESFMVGHTHGAASLPDDHPSDERLFLYSTAELMYPLVLSDAEIAEKAGDGRKRINKPRVRTL